MLDAEAEIERNSAVSREIATAVWANQEVSPVGQCRLPIKIRKGTVRVPPPMPNAPEIKEIAMATKSSNQISLAIITQSVK